MFRKIKNSPKKYNPRVIDFFLNPRIIAIQGRF
jgi:hypothetical protein